MSKQSRNYYQSNNRSTQHPDQGDLRIIAGMWRSRKLTFPAIQGLRPTPSRIRETLFNWLAPDLPGSHCLDLFAGSGALGFEALSRGADRVTMIEKNREITGALQRNKRLLGADGLSILNQDTMEGIVKLDPINSFDILFCDPPFNQHLMEPLIQAMENSTVLSENAKLYIETEKSLTNLEFPANWSLLKEKTAGDVRYRLLEVSERLLTP